MTIEISRDPQQFHAFEHDGWEAVSDGYERHFGRLTRQSVEPLLDAANVTSGTATLDVCTGPGVIALAAAARGARVTGIDFAAAAIAIARRSGSSAEFLEADAMNLPFDAARFDAVVCGFGIIHLPDPGRAVAEMARVLKPGGRLAVSVWEPPGPDNGFGLLYSSIQAHADMSIDLPHGPDFFQFSDEPRMSALLTASGLEEPGLIAAPQFWEYDAPEQLVTSFLEGAVRARGLILGQTEDRQAAIEETVANGMEKFRTDRGNYLVPMPALIGTASKP